MSEKNILEARSPRSFKWLIFAAVLLICLLVWWREKTTGLAGARQEQIATLAKVPSETRLAGKQILPVALVNPYWDKLSAALAAVSAESDAMRRDHEIQEWANGISIADMPFALQFLQAQAQTDMIIAMENRLIRRWAASDAEAAAMWVEQMPLGSLQQELLKNVSIVWANKNLADAITWAQGLADGSDQQNAIQAIAYEAARNSPLVALMLMTNLPAGSENDALIRYATTQWSRQDPSAAAQWAGQMQAGQLKDQLLADIATQWADRDPVAAATLALQSVPAGRLQDDAVVGIVERWAEQNPAQTAVWVEQFPSGNLQRDAVDNLISLWTVQGWQAPAQWLEELPDGSLRDTALVAFAQRVAPFNRTTALAWVEQIGNSVVRAQAAAQLGN